MAGPRPFDDDRFADAEGFAVCFLCGKKVDPRDPHRGSYTPNSQAFDGLPIHLPCLNNKDWVQVQAQCLQAMTQMTEANRKQAMREAAVVGAHGAVH